MFFIFIFTVYSVLFFPELFVVHCAQDNTKYIIKINLINMVDVYLKSFLIVDLAN